MFSPCNDLPELIERFQQEQNRVSEQVPESDHEVTASSASNNTVYFNSLLYEMVLRVALNSQAIAKGFIWCLRINSQ